MSLVPSSFRLAADRASSNLGHVSVNLTAKGGGSLSIHTLGMEREPRSSLVDSGAASPVSRARASPRVHGRTRAMARRAHRISRHRYQLPPGTRMPYFAGRYRLSLATVTFLARALRCSIQNPIATKLRIQAPVPAMPRLTRGVLDRAPLFRGSALTRPIVYDSEPGTTLHLSPMHPASLAAYLI
jgi:hypothetical protein